MIRACGRNRAILTASHAALFQNATAASRRQHASTMKYHCVFPHCRDTAAFVDCFFIAASSLSANASCHRLGNAGEEAAHHHQFRNRAVRQVTRVVRVLGHVASRLFAEIERTALAKRDKTKLTGTRKLPARKIDV